MTPWLLVAGDFMPFGGMDRANLALAEHLAADPDVELHLVTHRASDALVEQGDVTVHLAPRPFGSHLLGASWMSRLGERWARRLVSRGGRVVVNGGNCPARDVSWFHYVHAAYRPATRTGRLRAMKERWRHERDLAAERRTVAGVRLVVCNSERTRTDVVERLGVPVSRTTVIYYGVDGACFGERNSEERSAARAQLGLEPERPMAVFIGALGDRRKGFDVLLDGWRRLCDDGSWDVDLLAVGAGAELPIWQTRVRDLALDHRVRLLGRRRDVGRILAAADLLVHPSRYEAYGLGVHEALCRGVPAIVSATAGVAERFPSHLHDLLLADPEDVDDLVGRLCAWRAGQEAWCARVAPFGAELRRRGWRDMARDIVEAVADAA